MNIGQLAPITPNHLGELFGKEKAIKLFKQVDGETSTELDLNVDGNTKRFIIMIRELPLDKERSFWEVELYRFIQELTPAIEQGDYTPLVQKYGYKELEKNGQIRISRFTFHGFTVKDVRKMFRLYGLEFEDRLAVPNDAGETVPISWWTQKNLGKPIKVPTLVLENQKMWRQNVRD